MAKKISELPNTAGVVSGTLIEVVDDPGGTPSSAKATAAQIAALAPAAPVQSVNGQTGVVELDADDVGAAGKTRLWVPGTGSVSLSTPDVAALDITGDIEIVARIAPADWTPGAVFAIASKRSTGEGLSWQLTISTTGTMQFSLRTGSSDFFNNGTLTSPSALTDGTAYWLRFTRVASTGAIAGGHHADQPEEPAAGAFTAWTASGTRTSGNLDANNAPVEFGSERNGTSPMQGYLHQLIIRDGIGGTKVAHWRDSHPWTRYRDDVGRVWTIAGAGQWGYELVPS